MIFDSDNKIAYHEIEASEGELHLLLKGNFGLIFPELMLLYSEFVLQGDVRLIGVSGRIDLLAYDQNSGELVIIELKKNHTKNILIQAIDYSDFIEDNLEVILSRIEILDILEKKKILKEKKPPKLILIANEFLHPTIKRAEKLPNNVLLYEYTIFSNNMLWLKQLNNPKRVQLKRLFNDTHNYSQQSELPLFPIIREVIEAGLVENEYYKIESGRLSVNPTILHKAYKKYLTDKGKIPLSKNDFYKELRKSENFIRSNDSVRFLNKRTSAFELRV